LNPADAILAIIADEYDRNPALRASLAAELHTLGTTPIPEASLERVWMRMLGECSTAHAAEADSPHESQGITAHAPLLAPTAPAFGRGVGGG
jgi:hypothetical protein